MYGYVVPPKQITPEELTLFNSFYCGLCIRTGKLMGQRARLTTNYDMTFFSVLLHDLLTQDVKFEARTCILSPIRKRAVVGSNELLDKIAATNIILSYYKATDGVLDGEGIKYRIAKNSLRSAYGISKQAMPEVDQIVCAKYDKLRKLENANTVGIDRISDVFASMMSEVAEIILGDKACEDSLRLIYNIGKYVYLVDALDDVDEDYKAKRYNPYLAQFPYENRAKFFEDNEEFIRFSLNVTVGRAIECFNALSFTQSYNLLSKIVFFGLRQKVDELLSSKKKLKKPVIRAQAADKSDKENK